MLDSMDLLIEMVLARKTARPWNVKTSGRDSQGDQSVFECVSCQPCDSNQRITPSVEIRKSSSRRFMSASTRIDGRPNSTGSNPVIRCARTASLLIAEVTLPPNFRVPKHDHQPPHIVVVLDGAIRDHTRTGSYDLTAGFIRY